MCLKTIATAHSCCVLLSIFAVLQLSQASKKSVKSQSKENDSVSTTGVDTLAEKNSRDYSNLAKAARSAAIIRSSENMTVSVRKRTGTRLSKDINETAGFSSLEELPESMEGYSWPTCTYDNYDTDCGIKPSGGKFKQGRWVSSLSLCVYVGEVGLNWWNAKEWCRDQNVFKDKPSIELATPASQNEFKLTAGNSGKTNYWLGYDDQKEEGCFTSIRAKNKKSGCISWDSPFWKTRLHDGDFTDCAGGGTVTDYKIDDYDCSSKRPPICAEIISDRLFMEDAGVSWFDFPNYVVVGDMFTFTFRLSIRGGGRVYLKLNADDTIIYDWDISVGNIHHTNHNSKLLPRESQRVLYWEYEHWETYRRCSALVTIEVSLMARRAFQPDFYICYWANARGENSKIFRPPHHYYPVGHYFATMIKPQEDRLTIGGVYSFKCMLRLGNDDATTATVSIVNMVYNDNAEYKADGVQTWTRKYDYKTCSVKKETGTIPPNVHWHEVKCEDEDAMGGYHVNITFDLQGSIGSLHLRRIICTGDTTNQQQYSGAPVEKNSEMVDLNIRFPPQTPQLKIISNYPDGIVVAGGKIRAECTAYIGTVSYPQFITWLVYTVNQTSPRDEWEVHYPLANNLHIPGKTFSGRPGSMKCFAQDWEYKRTGKCVRFVKDEALSLDHAQQYCADHFKYGLLIIDDTREFRDMLAKTGDEGYWIGLDKRGSDGEYRWQDGSDGNHEQWGYWWEHNEEDGGLNPYLDGPEDKMCVILHKDGMEAFSCHRNMPFICQSITYAVPSYSNFDVHLGPNWTSIVEIDVNDFDLIQDTQLQCKTQRDSTVDEVMKQKGITEFSDKTASFRYVYAPLKPKITKIEQTIDGDFYMNLICSSVVAMEGGMMTWAITYHDGRATSYWRVKDQGKVDATNGHSLVNVKVIHDEEDKDSGRHIKSNMTIKINGDFQKCKIECYSYDFGTPLRWNITEDNLKDVYYMNLRYLDHIHFWQLEEKLGKNFLNTKDERFEKTGGANMAKGLLALISLMFVGFFVLKKDAIAARLIGEDGADKSRGTVIGGEDGMDQNRATLTGSRATVTGSRATVTGSRATVTGGRATVTGGRATVTGSQQFVP